MTTPSSVPPPEAAVRVAMEDLLVVVPLGSLPIEVWQAASERTGSDAVFLYR